MKTIPFIYIHEHIMLLSGKHTYLVYILSYVTTSLLYHSMAYVSEVVHVYTGNCGIFATGKT